jgi:selenocysteine lyase/cysteine desulfurase
VVTAPAQGTLVTFRAEGDTAELVRRLYEQGIVVRDVPGLGWIRVSCGWWTSDDDVERLVGALP